MDVGETRRTTVSEALASPLTRGTCRGYKLRPCVSPARREEGGRAWRLSRVGQRPPHTAAPRSSELGCIIPEARVRGWTRCSGGGAESLATLSPEGGNVSCSWGSALPPSAKAPGQNEHGVGGDLRTLKDRVPGEGMKQIVLSR